MQLREGPGLLSAQEPNADQILFNRIGTVFDDRVPSPRAAGAVLLWTDGVLDYYGVALNLSNGDELLQQAAANIHRTSDTAFTLQAPASSLILRFSGDPLEQWRSSETPLSYGFADNTFGEIDITVTGAKPGFVETFIGPATVTVHGQPGWLLASQSSLNMASYTLFWYEAPGEMVILTSDGRINASGLIGFANSLQPVNQASWTRLANRASSP